MVSRLLKKNFLHSEKRKDWILRLLQVVQESKQLSYFLFRILLLGSEMLNVKSMLIEIKVKVKPLDIELDISF